MEKVTIEYLNGNKKGQRKQMHKSIAEILKTKGRLKIVSKREKKPTETKELKDVSETKAIKTKKK